MGLEECIALSLCVGTVPISMARVGLDLYRRLNKAAFCLSLSAPNRFLFTFLYSFPALRPLMYFWPRIIVS